ncbi:AbrB/MazE/SpoVT family DNA-binding domain-containing protein [Acidobacteria bacterium ACD]|nr:AbrB/MazE/SpoVT family DNA-binding domain-containing protein [Acidobacteria bacterium ACD]
MGEPARVGKRGAVVIPARLRRRFGIADGTLVVFDEAPDGVLIRPAVAFPVETYSPERKAALILDTAVDAADYRRARREVSERLGIDPDSVPHTRPAR